MANDVTEWHPPQEKIIHRAVMGIGIFAAVVIGAISIKTFVPTIADALKLIQELLANTISLAITGAVLVAVLWLLWETFSSTGKINGLFSQAYSSFIHNMTLELLNVDPMSPLKDSLAAVKAKKATYDEQFAKFDGQISIFKAKEDDLRAKAKKAEQRAKAALASGDQESFKRLSYEQGTENDTANSIAQMRMRLEPIRAIIVRLQQYSGDLIWKLGIDIENTQTTWDAANSMSAMDNAARKILSNSGKSDLAAEAQNLVQSKYAAAIGRLENLNDLAKPLLDSADLDKATYSQDLLAKWQAEDAGTPMLALGQSAPPLALPMSSTSLGGSSFADLIKH
jgi:hypothetical protein